MGDRYIPNPHDGQYRPSVSRERLEAEERGNPHPFNSPAWHVWNNGYQAAVSKVIRKLTKGAERHG